MQLIKECFSSKNQWKDLTDSKMYQREERNRSKFFNTQKKNCEFINNVVMKQCEKYKKRYINLIFMIDLSWTSFQINSSNTSKINSFYHHINYCQKQPFTGVSQNRCFKKFAKFTGKHRWRIFCNKFFRWIFGNFKEQFFTERLQTTASTPDRLCYHISMIFFLQPLEIKKRL